MIFKTTFLFIFYFIIWLLLSGHYDPLLLSLGLISCIICLYVTWKANFIDSEGVPLHMMIRLPIYTIWLFREIIKANIDTAKIIIFNILIHKILELNHRKKQKLVKLCMLILLL